MHLLNTVSTDCYTLTAVMTKRDRGVARVDTPVHERHLETFPPQT